MIEFLTALIIGVSVGLFDRIRGGFIREDAPSKVKTVMGFVSLMMMGAIVAFALGAPSFTVYAIIMFGMWAGELSGWGCPYGMLILNNPCPKGPEWYQVGILKTNARLAILVRGLIWAAPMSLAAFLFPKAILLLAVFPLAMLAAGEMARYFAASGGFLQMLALKYNINEWTRGFLIGIMSFVVGTYPVYSSLMKMFGH